MQWRYDLKKGDLFDCCDDYGIWYRASVLERYESEELEDCEGNPVPILNTAFRYPDEHGLKTKDGVRVTGWISAEYDMHIEIGGPNI